MWFRRIQGEVKDATNMWFRRIQGEGKRGFKLVI